MPAVLWLVGLPIGAATLVFLLRRTWFGAILAVLITSLLAGLVVRFSTGVAFNLLGRTIELDELSKVTLFLLFGATALLFLVLYLRSLYQNGVSQSSVNLQNAGQEGRFFYPAALVILGLFAAASLSRHLGITAIFIEIAAILMVFVIQTERLESTRASLRFLILISLSTPLFLMAAWQIDFYQLSGGLVSSGHLERTALLVAVGFAIWLAVIPFHGWLISTAAESSPPTAAFVLITFPIVAFSTLMHLLLDLPWLVDSFYLVDAIILAGVFTAVVAGILAAVQRGFSELMGYTALFDIGCMLVILGLGGPAAVITILVSLAVRVLALVLIAVSLSTYYLQVPSVGFAQLKGLAYRMPFATAGLIIGGLTLAGVPFTVGFVTRWQLFSSAMEAAPFWPFLLVIGGFGVAVGYLRGLRATLDTNQAGRARSMVGQAGYQEPVPLAVIIVLISATCIVLGLFPWLIIEPLQTVSTLISFPIK